MVSFLNEVYQAVDIRTGENVFMYFWIAQNICWIQGQFYAGMILSFVTLMASLLALTRSMSHKCVTEVWHGIGQVLWVLGNSIWLYGQLHDYKFESQKSENGTSMWIAKVILGAGLGWLVSYYAIMLPFKLIDHESEKRSMYNETNMESRFSCLHSWRSYENIHIMLWLGKDFAWSIEVFSLWVVFAVPTFLVGCDMVYSTLAHYADHHLGMLCNYMCQLLWIVGNLLWAFNEIMIQHGSVVVQLRNISDSSSLDWWAILLMVLSFIPVILYYCTFIPVQIFIWNSYLTSTSGENLPLVSNRSGIPLPREGEGEGHRDDPRKMLPL